MTGFACTETSEGLVRFYIPVYVNVPSLQMPVFYNERMRFRRDVSVSMLEAVSIPNTRHTEVLDGLAATGVGGLRYAIELQLNITVTINDHNPAAFELITKNIETNRAINTVATRRDVNSLLSERFFDTIDLDPFGSPVPFLDAAFQSIKLNGNVFVTATDTGTLCGIYRDTCTRRYMASSAKTPYHHELGLRILAGFCARTAAKYDVAVKPLLCYSADHYYRLFLSTHKGSKASDMCLKKLGYVVHDDITGIRQTVNEVEPGQSPSTFPSGLGQYKVIGPLWTGSLYEKDILDKLIIKDHFSTKQRFTKMLVLWKDENDMPPLFYTLSELGSRYGSAVPKISTVVDDLRDNGYHASRTHIVPDGFKTDASLEDIKERFFSR